MDAVQELVPAHVVPSSDDKMSPRVDTVMVTLCGLDILTFVYWQCYRALRTLLLFDVLAGIVTLGIDWYPGVCIRFLVLFARVMARGC